MRARLHKNNLEAYVCELTWKTKGKGLYVPWAILACVWLFHRGFFAWSVKNYNPSAA